MSDSAESVKKQKHFKNLEGVHFTVRTSYETMHKISSTASLKRHDHISNKSLIFNENALLDHRTSFLPSLRPVTMKSRPSARSTSSVKSMQATNQLQFEQSTLHPKHMSFMEYDQEYWTLPLRKFHDECDVLSKHPSFTIKNIS